MLRRAISFFLITYALLFAYASYSFSRSPSNVEGTLKEISPGLYGVFGFREQPSRQNKGFTSNAYFVITKEGVLVFDTLGNYNLGRELIQTIKKRTKQPIRYVIVSHYHSDHFYGSKAFKEIGAVIIGHKNAYELLSHPGAQEFLENRKRQLGEDVLKGTELVGPDIAVDSDIEIRMEGEVFKVLHWCKAHSPEDLMVYIPSKRVLLAGDLVFVGRVPFLGSGSTRELLECLDRVLSLPIDILLPGHGDPLIGEERIKREVGNMRRYVQDLRNTVKRLFDEGYSQEEVVKLINDEMLKINPDYINLRVFSQATPRNAFYVYMEIEKEVLEGR